MNKTVTCDNSNETDEKFIRNNSYCTAVVDESEE